MNVSSVVAAAVLTAAFGACAPRPAASPRPDENAIRTALTARLAAFSRAMDGKDTAAVASMFTQNATWILSNASTYAGRAEIESGALKVFETMESAATGEVLIDRLVVVNDSEAVTFSHASYTQTLKGKRPESRLNPYADLWKRGADGVWRITYEVNADGPATSTVAPQH